MPCVSKWRQSGYLLIPNPCYNAPMPSKPLLVLGTANRRKGRSLPSCSPRPVGNCKRWPIFPPRSRWSKTARPSPPTPFSRRPNRLATSANGSRPTTAGWRSMPWRAQACSPPATPAPPPPTRRTTGAARQTGQCPLGSPHREAVCHIARPTRRATSGGERGIVSRPHPLLRRTGATALATTRSSRLSSIIELLAF